MSVGHVVVADEDVGADKVRRGSDNAADRGDGGDAGEKLLRGGNKGLVLDAAGTGNHNAGTGVVLTDVAGDVA